MARSEDDASTPAGYTHGYDPEFVKYLEGRSATVDAAILVPHLRPGMELLDCGCGPGSITLGLAQFVAPGQAVGIDIAAGQIELARALAQQHAVPNVRFEVASVTQLPFPDQSFDAAFAHTLLQHLADPVAALREIRRVLKPGGVVAVREEDAAGMVFAPTTLLQDQSIELYLKVWQHSGGDPYFARRQRVALQAAGFVNTVGTASAEAFGTPAATRDFGKAAAGIITGNLTTAVALGWVEQETVEAMGTAWRAWGEQPDAYFALLRCEAIGWKA